MNEKEELSVMITLKLISCDEKKINLDEVDFTLNSKFGLQNKI